MLAEKLHRAFELMGRRNLLAKQNFSCCQSCGGYEITGIAVELVKSGAQVDGCVFYHEQDADSLKRGEDFYLAYGNMSSTEFGMIGLPTEEVGKIVVDCLAVAGVPHEWDGSADTRILIRVATRSSPERAVDE